MERGRHRERTGLCCTCRDRERGVGRVGLGPPEIRQATKNTPRTYMAGVPGVCGLYCGLTWGEEGSG